jgi:hypothetical protein
MRTPSFRSALAAAALLATALTAGACGNPAGAPDNPRDREGAAAPPTWRIVAEGGAQAAFLSRPGAAPDLVLWCRGDGRITLRAHVFERPDAAPTLIWDSPQGAVAFEAVRAQGGMRADDRKLVEGSVAASADTLARLMAGKDTVLVRSGADSWQALQADPQGVMPGFTRACAAG